MRGRSWMYIFVLVLIILEINADVNPKEPFIAVHCTANKQPPPQPGYGVELYSNKIYISPLGQGPLDFSTTIPNDYLAIGMGYDYVDERFYVSQREETHRYDFDGSNKMIFNGDSDDIRIIPQLRKMVTSVATEMKTVIKNLDNSNAITISDIYLSAIDVIGTRILGAALIDGNIVSFDSDGSQLATYEIPTRPLALDVDVEAGTLYYLEYIWPRRPIKLYRLSLNDYNGTCVEKLLDTNELHGESAPENNYSPNKMAHYKDDIYIIGSAINNNNQFSGLGAINKVTGNLTNVGAGAFPDDLRYCNHIHIHDPELIEAEKNLVFSTGGDEDDDTDTAYSISIPLHVKKAFYGGMIAEMVLPIRAQLKDWKLKISFPRQVFHLEIEGCSAEVLSKTRREYGRRKGTDYVIAPTEESRSPPLGEDLKITIIAKTFKKVRNMKRDTSVKFMPDIDLDLRCGNMTSPAI